ncbi:GNAT family N-acetyltransferase [Nocardioides sp. R-C-SC26]|uniref:GNAT family N-acetyltransferase n=1 Tax=Nocardioides sp. R-C-SC26 TaxID=2870414 RepID=UPI001E569AF9|nr:GNAT family N-acetyltransferase [Nocardioides sp. R-C-SC26]
MTYRSSTLRAATLADAGFLAGLWADALRRADVHEQVADAESLVKAAQNSPERRLLIAEYEGRRAGAVMLEVTTVSAINLEPAVHVHSPHVLPEFRRHGVGRLLMESGVAFAEEAGIATISIGVANGSRDANRFMARLALAPLAMLRTAPTVAVRARLEAQRPSSPAGRNRTRVVAMRRTMRRHRDAAQDDVAG